MITVITNCMKGFNYMIESVKLTTMNQNVIYP